MDLMVPELPTIAESGVPGYEFSTWYGVLAPAKTPAEIISRLQAEIARGDHPRLRMLSVPLASSTRPQAELPGEPADG